MLKQHSKKDDAWTAISGKVYNMTPYLPYHPGGEKELMRVAGRDGTKLFGEWLGRLVFPSLTHRRDSPHPCLGVRRNDDGYLYGRSNGFRLTIDVGGPVLRRISCP
jgi:hypothetical protein